MNRRWKYHVKKIYALLLVPACLMLLYACEGGGGSGGGSGSGENVGEDGTVVLTLAALNSPVPKGTAPMLMARLENTGSEAAKLAAMIDGSFIVKSVKRDGTSVQSRTTVAYYDDGIEYAISRSLISVEAGGQLDYFWRIFTDPGLGAPAIYSVELDSSGIPIATFYSFAESGTYTVTASYRYGGRSGAGGYSHETESAQVQLVVE